MTKPVDRTLLIHHDCRDGPGVHGQEPDRCAESRVRRPSDDSNQRGSFRALGCRLKKRSECGHKPSDERQAGVNGKLLGQLQDPITS